MATQNVTEGKTHSVGIAGFPGVDQGLEKLGWVLRERRWPSWELVNVGRWIGLVADDLRYATVAPLGGNTPFAGSFDVDRFVPLPRTIVEELEWQPEGFLGLLLAGRAILDGDVGGTCLHVERARTGGEGDGGARAASTECAPEHGTELECQTASNWDQWGFSSYWR